MEFLTEYSIYPASPISPTYSVPEHDQGQHTTSLAQFYEALIIFSLLGPSTTPARKPRPKSPWHEFLDHLSWLCDFECGGKTVTSLGVQEATSGPVFWMAMNTRLRKRAVDHLKSVLSELSRLCYDPETEVREVQSSILSKSVIISRKKVDHYKKCLTRSVRRSLSISRNEGTSLGK